MSISVIYKMQYADYVFEDNFKKRFELTKPLILNELIKPIETGKKTYFKWSRGIDVKKDWDDMLTITRNQILIHIDNMIQNENIGEFLYYGEKSLKNKAFMLRFMTYLTDLQDRIFLYNAFITKQKIPLKTIKRWYNDIYYKFKTLRLEYSRDEQDAYHKRQGLKSIDLIDIERRKNGLFTRNELTANDLKVDKQNLFTEILPELILKQNSDKFANII